MDKPIDYLFTEVSGYFSGIEVHPCKMTSETEVEECEEHEAEFWGVYAEVIQDDDETCVELDHIADFSDEEQALAFRDFLIMFVANAKLWTRAES